MMYVTFLRVCSIILLSHFVDNVYSLAEGSSYFFYQQPIYQRGCEEIFDHCARNNTSIVYLIKLDGFDEGFEVYCDNQAVGGGWTVFQSRKVNNSVGLRRNVTKHEKGFGFLSGEFWLGNERLSVLTNQETKPAGSSFYAEYDLFRISDEWSNYKLTSMGQYDRTADTFIGQCPKNTTFAYQGTCAVLGGRHKRCNVEKSCRLSAKQAFGCHVVIACIKNNADVMISIQCRPGFDVMTPLRGLSLSTSDGYNERHGGTNCADDSTDGLWLNT